MRLPILENAETLRKFLEDFISTKPKGRAKYITLTKRSFSNANYKRLLALLAELKNQGVLGYREWENSVSIVIHKRTQR